MSNFYKLSIWYNDLKLKNILLNFEIRAKLYDFKSNDFYNNLNNRFYDTVIWTAFKILEDDNKTIYSYEKVDI